MTVTVHYDREAPRERCVIVEQNGHVMYRFTIYEARAFIKDLEEAVEEATC